MTKSVLTLMILRTSGIQGAVYSWRKAFLMEIVEFSEPFQKARAKSLSRIKW